MKFLNSTLNDLEIIFGLFEAARIYQEKNGYDLWPRFEKKLIGTEISEKRHWKIVEGDTIVCVLSVMYNDPVIWKEKDKDPAVYLHRIAVNPLYKGRGIMKNIKTWALEHARQNGKQFVRMDTWGNNQPLRQYYISCGFNYIGQQYLDKVDGQPGHYGGPVLSLFELRA